MKPVNFRWSMLLTIGLVVTSIFIIGASAVETIVAADSSPVPTLNVPPLALNTATPSAVPTGARSSLHDKPTATEEEVLGPFAAMTQMMSTLDAIPTATPMPSVSEIKLDGKPHFVDFNATWCGPCNAMRPYVVQMKARYGDRITFDNVDTDNPNSDRLAIQYNVQFIPLMVLLDKNGKLVNRLEGYQTIEQLDEALLALLGDSPQPNKSSSSAF